MKRLLLLLAVSSLALACASTRPVNKPAAVIDVVNRTHAPADVFLDGYLIGVVGPDKRRSYPGLPSGSVSVDVVARDGSARALQRVELARGRRVLVELISKAHPGPFAGHAALVVENPYDFPFRLQLGQEDLGALFEEATRRFEGLPAGPQTLTVLSPTGVLEARMELDLTPDQERRVRLKIPTGTLVVANGLDQPVRVQVDGRAAGEVAPHARRTLSGTRTGLHRITAIAGRSLQRFRIEEVLSDGEVAVVHLEGKPGTFVVRNAGPESFALAVDGRDAVSLARGGVLHVDQILSGEHRASARGATSGSAMFTSFTIAEGETVVWTLRRARGVLEIINRTREQQALQVDGDELARIDPLSSLHLHGIRTGAREIGCVGASSGVRQARTVEVYAERSTSVVIEAPRVTLRLVNTLPEAVRVYQDARFLVDVDAGRTRTLEHLPAGRFLLEALGVSTGQVVRRHVAVEPGQSLTWRVARSVSKLRLVNRAGEALRCPPELMSQRERVMDGEDTLFELTPGARTLKLVGDQSGFVYSQSLPFEADVAYDWEVARPRGAVQVFNETREPARLQLDQRDLGLLPAGERMFVESVPAGRVMLIADLQRSGHQVRRHGVLQPEAILQWSLEEELGLLLVENLCDESVHLLVDGEEWTRLEPDEQRLFDRISIGAHRLEAHGVRTGDRIEVARTITPRSQQRWAIRPNQGTIHVRNQCGEPVRVSLGGRVVKTLQPGAEAQIAARSGKTRVVIRGERSYDAIKDWLFIHPSRTLTYDVRHLKARVTLRNELPIEATLHTASARIGALPAGGEISFDTACASDALEVRATLSDGDERVRTLRCAPNEHVRWEIR